MSVSLAKALEARRNANEFVAIILKRDYPLDASVKWRIGSCGAQHGTVVMHGYDDRLKVRNDFTKRERWIYAGDIVAAAMAKSP